VNLTEGGQPAFDKAHVTVVPAVWRSAVAASTGGARAVVAPSKLPMLRRLAGHRRSAIVTTTTAANYVQPSAIAGETRLHFWGL